MTLSLLSILGDAMWIVAMAMIASGSQRFWRRLPPDARVPMQFGFGGQPTWRASRGVALVFVPVLATVIGLVLLVAARTAESADAQLLIFGVRAFTASTLALAHFLWLTAALKTLAAEGALKP